MPPADLVTMFERCFPEMCVACEMAWSDFFHPSVDGNVCSQCFCSREDLRLVPRDTLMKSEWLPPQELFSRDMVKTIEMSKKFYETIKEKSWPRFYPGIVFCSLQEVQELTSELFGQGNVSKAEKRRIYTGYEALHLSALREKWGKIASLGLHWETVLSFIDDHGIKQPEAYMTRVTAAFRRDVSYGHRSFHGKFHRYGNAMLPCSSKWKGTIEEAHKAITRRCCETSFPREIRANPPVFSS